MAPGTEPSPTPEFDFFPGGVYRRPGEDIFHFPSLTPPPEPFSILDLGIYNNLSVPAEQASGTGGFEPEIWTDPETGVRYFVEYPFGPGSPPQLSPVDTVPGGGGSIGRYHLPGELENLLANTAYTEAQTGLLGPQFEFAKEQQGALNEYNAAQLLLGRDRLGLEEMLGIRGLEVDEAQLALSRELGFANLESQNKDRALTGAISAMNAFLEARSQADARRIAAFQETRALIPFMVDPERESFFDPEGPLARAAGPSFNPPPINHIQVPDPQGLLAPPTPEQVGFDQAGLQAMLPQG